MGKTESGQYKIVEKGQLILKEGQVNTRAYMVKKGTVLLSKDINNRQVEVARVLPGQIFGVLPLLSGDPFFATAEALDQCQLIPFDKNLLQSMLLKCPAPVQRMVRHMAEQIVTLSGMLQAQSTEDPFISICKILELLCVQTKVPAPAGSGKGSKQCATRYSEFVKAVRDILLVTQMEIDTVLEKLQKVNLIQMREMKPHAQQRDDSIQENAQRAYGKDRILIIMDKDRFIEAARTLRNEMLTTDDELRTRGLSTMDIHELASKANVDTDSIYQMLSKGIIPERLIFFPKNEVMEWLQTFDPSHFQPATVRLKSDRWKVIDDIVGEKISSVRKVVPQFDLEKIIVLYAAAGKEARQVILEALSPEDVDQVRRQAVKTAVSNDLVAQYEKEFFDLLNSAS